MNFSEFLRTARDPKRANFNSWIDHPGFKGLYLRYGQRLIEQKVVFPVLDIATIETVEKGKGTFKKFIAFLRAEYPMLNLYVENAHPQFGEGLVRMGFKRLEDHSFHNVSSNYFMPSEAKSEQPQEG